MAATAFAELELGLHRRSPDAYTVELRFSGADRADAESGISDYLHADVATDVRIDRGALQRLAHDPEGYGRALRDALFADPDLKTSFALYCERAHSREVPLRLRLVIGPSAPELHQLRWETLLDPRVDEPRWLVASERILFSRYLSSAGYISREAPRKVRLRSRAQLEALVAIAAPSDLGPDLAPIDVEAERARAEAALTGLKTTWLAGPGQATLTNLLDHVREGCDVLYLVAHGAIRGADARLWLENERGEAALTEAGDLIEAFEGLPQLPRLVVLASCQSAGAGGGRAPDAGGEVLRALGPRLAAAGVPAVLAMQGDFSMESARLFLPAFFEELLKSGLIDQAAAVARGTLRGRPDSWMPVLFLRLRSGRLWYTPGFTGGEVKWPSLNRLIARQRATPILGPGLTDALLGSHREIAQRWSEEYNYPLAPENRGDLPQVAQYLKVREMASFPVEELLHHIEKQIRARYAEELGAEVGGMSLVDMHSAVFRHYRETNPNEPHKVLAQLPFPLYITTNVGNAMADALREQGRQPRTEISRWNERTELLPSVYDTEPAYVPDVQNPLIYHVFGHLEYPESIVLTEDDHFDYLIGLTRRYDEIPSEVRAALASTGLLFLGFQMDNWAFRVLFRSILSHDGNSLLRQLAHVAVQVEPEEDAVLSPRMAKEYINTSFSRGLDPAPAIDVFWGNAEEFATALLESQQRERQP